MINKLRLLLATTALAAIAAPALAQAPVAAQESVLDELIVTAQKREQRLQDVPVTVSVVSGEQLARQNIVNAADLQNASPELTYTSGPSSGYSIRGSGTSTFARSAENNVSIVVDGVIQGSLFQPTGSLFDVARVEVLSGPQGMLFGKNASAGVINIVTTTPSLSGREFIAHADIGTEGYQVYQGVANLPLGETMALRLSGFGNSMDDMYRNRFNGSSIGGYTNVGGRARLLWEPMENLSVNAILDYEKQDGGNAVWQSRIATGALLTALTACGVTPGPENTDVCLDGPVRRDLENYGASLQLDYDFDQVTFTSITANRQLSRDVNTDSDTRPTNILNQNLAVDFTNQFSQEFRIASPTGSRFEYVAGLFYYNYAYKAVVDQAGTLGALPFAAGRASITKVNQFSYAIFGQGTYRLTDTFRLVAGARLTHDFLRANVFNYVDTRTGVRFPGFTPPEGRTYGEQKTDNFSYRLGVQYDLAPEATLFATYTRGYKGPAIDFLPGQSAANIVEPEIPKNFEVGVKATLFDRRVALDATLYSQTTENFQAQTVRIVGGLSSFVFTNADELKAQGVQVNLYSRPFEGFTLNAGVLYNKTEYGDFVVQCNAPYLTGCAPIGGVQSINVKGRRLANAPEWKTVLSAGYEWPVFGGWEAFVNANATYRSETFSSATPDPNLVIKGYTIVDGRVGVRTEDGRFGVALFGRNLFDERQPALIFRDPLAPTNNYDQAFANSAFRVVGISLDARY